MSQIASQEEVFSFLRSPHAWHGLAGPVDVIETHGALVFMAGDEVLKVRRAVQLAYLNFSTLEARHRFAEREIALNAPHATGLYRGVVAITREADGTLAIGGRGVPVEWAVRMARFSQDALLLAMVRREALSEPLAKSLADAVYNYHATAPVSPHARDHVPGTFRSVLTALADTHNLRLKATLDRLVPLFRAAFESSAAARDERLQAGFVRRCHGDLHLGNIVMWQGRPVPFDAIEFDEDLATIDTLYDLAFLLMDLDRHVARAAANIILNRYLWRSGDPCDLRGLAILPLYLALRAAIRAMVGLDRVKLGIGDRESQITAALETLKYAEAYLTPVPPQLIAIGGLSGTGKTTLAKALAPFNGAAVGALQLRSDLERKWLAGVGETERLPEASYTVESARAAYDRVTSRAVAALRAGHCVIVDSVFAMPAERNAIQEVAQQVGCAFKGLWLAGSSEVLKARVASRIGDASDATAAVVERQFSLDTGAIIWTTIKADAAIEDVLGSARAALKTHDIKTAVR